MSARARRLASVLSVSLILLGAGPKPRAAWPLLTITCPQDRTLVSPSGDGAFVDLLPATTTGGRKPITQISNPPSGSWFPIGDTAVLVSASSRDNQAVACTYTVSLTPPATPAAPSGLSVSSPTTTTLTLTWIDNSTNETGFEVEQSSGGGPFSLRTTVGANVLTTLVTGLTASTTYSFRVRAISATAQSTYSNTASGTTSPVSTGATFYVSRAAGASDSNAGTQAAPFATITKGLSVMSAGATLYLRGGTYPALSYPSTPNGTSWTSPITVASFPGETATIVGFLNFSGSSVRQYISFDRIVVDGATSTIGAAITWDGPNHHLRFQNGEIKNSIHQGLYMGPGPSFCEILNNVIHHNGSSMTPQDHNLYIEGNNTLIEGNDVYEAWAHGLQVYSGTGTSAHDNVVRRNRFHNNGRNGGGNGSGFLLGSGSNNIGYNNLVYSNPSVGIALGYGTATTNKLYNNTVYGNGTGSGDAGIQVFSGTGHVIRNNIVFGNGSTFQNIVASTQSNNVTANPLFVNAGAADFHLQVGSPAINTGVAVAEVTTDFDGVVRANPPDVGAYEK